MKWRGPCLAILLVSGCNAELEDAPDGALAIQSISESGFLAEAVVNDELISIEFAYRGDGHVTSVRGEDQLHAEWVVNADGAESASISDIDATTEQVLRRLAADAREQLPDAVDDEVLAEGLLTLIDLTSTLPPDGNVDVALPPQPYTTWVQYDFGGNFTCSGGKTVRIKTRTNRGFQLRYYKTSTALVTTYVTWLTAEYRTYYTHTSRSFIHHWHAYRPSNGVGLASYTYAYCGSS